MSSESRTIHKRGILTPKSFKLSFQLRPTESDDQQLRVGVVLWHEHRNDTPVYSVIPAAGTQYNSFDGDLLLFYTHLEGINGALLSLFLQSIQAGTD